MEYNYSRLVPTDTYDTDGLSFHVSLRNHRDPYKEERGALQAQRDWHEQVSLLSRYHGGLGPAFSFVRVTVPECLPDRLEIMSYANEFAFLYDDEMEKLELRNDFVGDAHFLEVFDPKSALQSDINADTRPEKRLQAAMLKKMRLIDPLRSITSMNAWAVFVQLASRTRFDRFETLADYIPSRVIDAGELFWYGVLTFGMALTIPEEELDLCFELARPGYAALGLVNDLYSWSKEKKAAEDVGLDYVFNAIWVIMKESSVSEEEAIMICRKRVEDEMSTFNNNLVNIGVKQLSKDTVAYLEAVRYSYIGNLVWSIYCPRYHGGNAKTMRVNVDRIS